MNKYALTAQQLRLAKLEYEVAQANADDKKKEYEKLRTQLCNDMIADEVLKFTMAADTENNLPGLSFRLENKERYSPVIEEKGTLIDILKADAPELFTINSATLNKYLTSLVEDNAGVIPDKLQGLIKKYDDTHVVVRSSK